MKTALLAVTLLLSWTPLASAQGTGFQDELLDNFAGEWVMRGMIAGGQVNHDVVAEWVLAHNYMRFTDVARELDEHGNPAYEAIVFIGWDEPSSRYVCQWLDITGGGGLHPKGLGYAVPQKNKIPWVFDTGDGSIIYNTFTYVSESDTWHWLIDIDRAGEVSTFADVILSRS